MKLYFYTDLQKRLDREFNSNRKFYENLIKELIESNTEFKIDELKFEEDIDGQANKTTYMGIAVDNRNSKIAYFIVIPPNVGTRTGYIAQQVFPGLTDEIDINNNNKNAYLSMLPVYILDLDDSEITTSAALNIAIVKKLGFNFFTKKEKKYITKLNEINLNGFIYSLQDFDNHINKVATRNGNTFFEIDELNRTIKFKTTSLKDGIKITNEPYFYVMKAYLAAFLSYIEGYEFDLTEFEEKIPRGNKTLDVFRDYCIKLKELRKTNFIPNLKEKNRIKGGKNTLLYGVPGSGKSYTISKEYCNDESKIERIVFHPDYMNTDFIGQILPTIKEDKTITYEFTPGPFTRIMKKAYEDPINNYYLIIEEINRGNAPAIFGDVFQLLDRNSIGESAYSIKNYNVANTVYGDDDKPISIPSNLSILATMNTADQNVFTLDTAFQRRWIMRLIKNDVSKAEHADIEILDTGITWEDFNTTINDFILANNASTMSSEDKRLGAYFITKDILESKNESVFSEKVIKYLWDDAFKFARNKLFDSNYRSLEKVIDDFNSFDGFNRFNVFTTEVRALLMDNVRIKEMDIIEQDNEETLEE